MTKNIKDKKASLLERATEGLDKPKPLSEEKIESIEQSKFISKKRAETVEHSETVSEKDSAEANIMSASGSDDETYTSSFRGLGNSKKTHSEAAHDQQEGVEGSWEFQVVGGKDTDRLTVGMSVYESQEAFQAIAPAVEDGLYLVPKVID